MEIRQLCKVVRQIVARNGKDAITRIRQGDSRGIDFSGIDFSGIDFSEMDFSDSDFIDSDFSGADFSGANFSGANFSGTYFERADFSGADFSGANFHEANFSGTYFSGADFSRTEGIRWADCSWHAHGECGRRLLALELPGGIKFFCGCFRGTEEGLREYIAERDPKLAPSCIRALEFCLGCFP